MYCTESKPDKGDMQIKYEILFQLLYIQINENE